MFREEQLEVTTVNWRNITQFQSDLTHLFWCFNPLFTRKLHNKSRVDISLILKCFFLKSKTEPRGGDLHMQADLGVLMWIAFDFFLLNAEVQV